MMKSLRFFCACVLAGILSLPAFAQLELPQPSPAATVSQVVGLTKVSLEYSAPSVRGRKIWGDLVPFNEPWRAGANSATKITFAHNVKINGKTVPAGTYSLFVTPYENNTWEFHINTGESVFAYEDPATRKVNVEALRKNDVASMVVNATPAEMMESMLYYIVPVSNTVGHLTLHWEKMKAALPIEMDTDRIAKENVDRAVRNADGQWATYRSAASFHMEQKNYAEALKLIDKSIAMRGDYFWNRWIKSRILAEQGNYTEAVALAIEALSLGNTKPDGAFNFYKSQIESDLNAWRPKATPPARKGRR